MHDLHMAQLRQTWSMQEAGQDVTFGCKRSETSWEQLLFTEEIDKQCIEHVAAMLHRNAQAFI